MRLGLDAHRVLFPTRRTPRALAHHLRTEVRPAMRRMLAAAVRESVAFDPDVVVHHPLILSAPMAADALGVPRVLVEFAPVATPSQRFPAAGGPTATRDLGPRNRSPTPSRAPSPVSSTPTWRAPPPSCRAVVVPPGGRRHGRRSWP